MVEKKYAVFGWQQTGNEGAAIVPQKVFDSLEEAVAELERFRAAEEWLQTAPTPANKFPHRELRTDFDYDKYKEEVSVCKAELDAIAGVHAEYIRWLYETHPSYRTAVCRAKITEPLFTHIQEIFQ